MKNKIIIFLILLILINMCSCSQSKDDIIDNDVHGTLIIGDTTQLTGNFWSSKWGNNAVDKMVRDLIHGYNTVTYKKESNQYDIDFTVVKKVNILDNSDGSKTFEFTINNNLYWNDRVQVTASDYVFSILIGSSSYMNDMLIDSTDGLYYKGYKQYVSGVTDIFEGVRYIDTYTFSVTITSEYLPYFYEICMASVEPTPMHIILPNARITDNGSGSQIICDKIQETICKTILDPENGYRYFPKVTCGPYKLENYSTTTHVAILEYNPIFVGDYKGQTPNIEKLIIKTTNEETQIDELISGTVDILPAVSGVSSIECGLKASDSNLVSDFSYPRNGYGGLMLNCSYGATKSVRVRQAIACCLDRNEIVRQYSGGYATVVYSYYGIGQWMYQNYAEKINSELDKYSLDLNRAKNLLIDDGWVFNGNGQKYTEGKDVYRYKMVDETLVPLIVRHLSSTGNEVSDIICSMLKYNLEQIGCRYEYSTVDFTALYDNIYSTENVYNIFTIGVEFPPIFDPYFTYVVDDRYFGTTNTNHLMDFKLMFRANELRMTNSSNKERYLNKWFDFQKRWNEMLPDIPIYSDDYYCFYSTKLIDYYADTNWSFQKAILYARLE